MSPSESPSPPLAPELAAALAEPTARNIQRAARVVEARSADPAFGRPLRLAVLASANLDGLAPYLLTDLALAGFSPTLYMGPFGQIAQEALRKDSGLWRFAPDAVVVAARTQDLLPEVWDRFDPGAAADAPARVRGALEPATAAVLGGNVPLVLLHDLETPSRPPEGLVDHQRTEGAVDAVRRVNRELAVWAADTPGMVLFDYEGLTARFGKERWWDPRLWHLGRIPLAAEAFPALSRETVRYLRAALTGPAKCLVLDLDNTLWGGVLGEEGVDGIALGHAHPGSAFRAFQEECLNLYRRGILLAVASKNNPGDVDEVFASHPGMVLAPDHFAAMARDLNLGLDAFVFLDDSPVERERVRTALPEVSVPELPADPARYASFLRDLPDFEQITLSEEDRGRTAMYRAESKRKRLAAESGDLEGFLAGLEMTLTLGPVSGPHRTRVAQLTQKTNQFNLTTHRYTAARIAAFTEDPNMRLYRAHLSDRFGDNGLIGVVIVRMGAVWEIDTFLLSCRVMGRSVETAILAHVLADAKNAGAGLVRGAYIPTRKNPPAADLYERHGFAETGPAPGGEGSLWEIEPGGDRFPGAPAYITVVVSEA
jgi:FkbH-like protein